MEIQTLNKWADLLLDMGKRNNLINFRNTKIGTAEIVAPDLSIFFSQISHTAEFEVYDPKLEDDDDDFDFIEDAIPGSDPEESGSSSEYQKYSKEQYRSMYERRLKRGQILIYNSAYKPIQALKNISKKGRTAIDETGVNILYLAFGFIHWTEDGNSQYVMKAPLLLVPVSIENDSEITFVKGKMYILIKISLMKIAMPMNIYFEDLRMLCEKFSFYEINDTLLTLNFFVLYYRRKN